MRKSRRVLRIGIALVGVVLAFGLPPPAHGQQSGTPSGDRSEKVQLQVVEFTKLGGAARLDFLQTELPHLLAASFLSYSWLDVALADPAVGERAVARNARDQSPRTAARAFQLRGTFVEIGNKIRVDLALKDLANDRVSRMFELLDEDALLVSVHNLGKRIAATIESRLSSPANKQVVFGIASHFTKTEGPETYGFLGDLLPEATFAILSKAKLDNVRFQQLLDAAGENSAAQVASVVTGEYSVFEKTVQITARMQEKDGPTFRIAFKGSVNEIPRLSEELSRRVAEIARGRVTPEGKWRNEEVSLRNASAQQYFAQGEEYSEAKQDAPAIVMFRKALEVKPDFVAARSRLVQIYMSQKDYDAAISESRLVLEFNPDLAATRYQLGTAYLRKGDHQEATRQFQEALRPSGRDPQMQANLYSGLGDAFSLQGRYDEAIVHYLQAKEISRESPDVYYLLARAYAASGKFQEGIQTLEDARRRFPRDSGFTAELASMYTGQGKKLYETQQYDQALQAFEKSIGYQRSVKLPHDDGQGLAEALSYAGRIVGFDRPVKDVRKGIEYMEQSVKLDTKNEWSLRALGALYANDRNYDEAIRRTQQALEIQPTQWAYQQMSEVYRLMGKYEAAVDAANRALKIRSDVDGYIPLSLAYSASRDYDKALQSIQSALSVDPANELTYRVKGSIYQAKGDLALAIEALKKALGLRPTADAYQSLGSVYERMGKSADAVTAEREALKLDPHLFAAYDSLSRIQLSQKDYRGALDTARKAIEYTGEGYNFLNEAYHGLGKDREAVRILEEYRQKDPSNWNILNPLEMSYHDRLFDYERAYQITADAHNRRSFDINVETNFAEACLTTGRYDDALRVANSALTTPRISPDQQLSMRLISIAALLFQGKPANAFSELGEFIRNYKSLPRDFEQTWIYAGTSRLVRNSAKLDESAKSLILSLIDILQSPRPEGDRKLALLETSLQDRLELKKGAAR